MANPLSNRKKVRGWKRRIRDVERWAEFQAHRDLAEPVAREGYAYTRIWINPWYRLTKRDPPQWLQQRIVEGLLQIHDSWTERLPLLGSPVHIRIWLAHPRFMECQVVGAVGDRARAFADAFRPAPPVRPFPQLLLARRHDALASFRWECRTDDENVAEDDLERPEEIARLLGRGWRREEWSGERCLSIRRGDVWEGTRVAVAAPPPA